MRTTLPVLALSLLLSAGTTSAGDNFPYYSARSATAAPSIDGRLDDACWRSVEKTTPFVKIGGKEALAGTRGMLCRDEETLYVAMICDEPLMETLKERLAEGLIKPFEESVEIFIDSNYDRAGYLQFRVGAMGEKDVHRMHDLDTATDSEWTAAAAIGTDSWTVEAAIPFECLDITPAPDTICGLNLNRSRTTGIHEWTCWSDTKAGFHSPSRFGNLIFADRAEWLSLFLSERIERVRKDVLELRTKYPGIVRPDRGATALDDEWREFLGELSGHGHVKMEEGRAEGNKLVAKYEELLASLRLEIIAAAFGNDPAVQTRPGARCCSEGE